MSSAMGAILSRPQYVNSLRHMCALLNVNITGFTYWLGVDHQAVLEFDQAYTFPFKKMIWKVMFKTGGGGRFDQAMG